jgi:hypothetical protein
MWQWSFWDWIAYGCLGIAALGLAVGQILKDNRSMLEQLPAIFMSKKWAYAPIILFSLGSAILAVRVGTPMLTAAPPSVADSPKQSIANSNERVFLDVTPDYLLDLTQDQTTIYIDKIAEMYTNKWLKVNWHRVECKP